MVVLVPLAQPELLLVGDVPIGRSRSEVPPVNRMAVDQQLCLGATHWQRDMVPLIVRETVRKRLHIHFIVHTRGIVQTDFVLSTARLELQVAVETVREAHYAPGVAHFLSEPRWYCEFGAAPQEIGDLMECCRW